MSRPAEPAREVLTTHQVAAALKVSDGRIRRWLDQGRILGELVDGRWQIPADELDRLLARERQARSWRATHTSHTKAATTRSAANIPTGRRRQPMALQPRRPASDCRPRGSHRPASPAHRQDHTGTNRVLTPRQALHA